MQGRECVRIKGGSLCYGNGDWFFAWNIQISVSFFALPSRGCWTISSGGGSRCYGIEHSTFPRKIHISVSTFALMWRGCVTVSIRFPQVGSGEKSVRKEMRFLLLRNIHSAFLKYIATKNRNIFWISNQLIIHFQLRNGILPAVCQHPQHKYIKGRVKGPYYICCSNFNLTAVSDVFQA